MGITLASIRRGISAIHTEIESEHQLLNRLDAQIGDGNLGVTLVKGFSQLEEISNDLPEDVSKAIGQCAMAMIKVSSSSFGTLCAGALMAVSKSTQEGDEVEWSEVSAMMRTACDAVMQRGKANIGDKTIVDVLDAVAIATEGLSDPAEILAAAQKATTKTLESFKQRQSQIGRARIFGEKTVGLDDPGMVAFDKILAGLATIS